VPGLEEVYVWLLSRIGTPINQPSAVSVQVIPKGGIDKQTYIQAEEVVASEFDRLSDFCRDLARAALRCVVISFHACEVGSRL
jgi:S-adenosylmethionine synthetase